MPKTYKLHHGEYTIHYGGIHGLCIYPDRLVPDGPDQFWIWLDDRLRGRKKLDTLIHELLHAEHPTMSEEDVSRTATHIMSVLWGEGYRHKEEVR